MRIPEGHGQATWFLDGDCAPTGAVVTCGFFNAVDQTALACAIELSVVFDSYVMPAVVDGLHYSGCLVKLGPNDDGPSALSVASTNGSISAAGAAPNLAALISKLTNVGGREGRGRFFLPGLPEGEVSESGFISSGHLTVLQDAVSDFRTFAEAQDVPLELLHNSTRVPSGITGLQAQSQCATQRRRLRR